MEFERVKLDVQGNVGIVTLNHPEVMNAVSAEMLGGLCQLLVVLRVQGSEHRVDGDPRIEAVDEPGEGLLPPGRLVHRERPSRHGAVTASSPM